MPAESVETLTPMVQHRRELRTDSGGPGRFRGGLGQRTEMSCRTDQPWTLSAMIDRISYPAEGLLGGKPGLAGELAVDGSREARPKRLLVLDPANRVHLDPPGGGGYGDPFTRDPEAVLRDVIEGYVSLGAAERDYGVAIDYLGRPDGLVRLPEHYRLDPAATEQLRRRRRTEPDREA